MPNLPWRISASNRTEAKYALSAAVLKPASSIPDDPLSKLSERARKSEGRKRTHPIQSTSMKMILPMEEESCTIESLSLVSSSHIATDSSAPVSFPMCIHIPIFFKSGYSGSMEPLTSYSGDIPRRDAFLRRTPRASFKSGTIRGLSFRISMVKSSRGSCSKPDSLRGLTLHPKPLEASIVDGPIWDSCLFSFTRVIRRDDEFISHPWS